MWLGTRHLHLSSLQQSLGINQIEFLEAVILWNRKRKYDATVRNNCMINYGKLEKGLYATGLGVVAILMPDQSMPLNAMEVLH